MIGYIVLLISFPVQMTQWPAPAGLAASSLAETWNLAWGNISAVDIDGFTGATALDYTKTQLGLAMQLGDISHAEVYGSLGAQAWEWVALAYLLGGVALIALRVMPWHAPLGMLLALFTLAQLMHFYDADSFPGGLFQLFSGGAMLGAFFIITDPVSGCTSNRGRFIFGVLVGLLVYLIRTWGNYPDGIAFSVLLANMAAPTIDYYSKPRVFGTSDASGKGGKNG
ncbi:MAG: hypothetical protein CSA54_03765 [Gammaproteobacteria bacterium]|nr:MAG: hypothetical protein CSA54_03765 [Gammaproteobacteria bacterium]